MMGSKLPAAGLLRAARRRSVRRTSMSARDRAPLAVALVLSSITGLTGPVSEASAFSCADVVFVGVRESGAAQSVADGLGNTLAVVHQGFMGALAERRTVSVEGLQYPAASTSAL